MLRTVCPRCFYTAFWKLRRDKLKCRRCRKELSTRFPLPHIRATARMWKKCIKIFLRERIATRIAAEISVSLPTAQKMCVLLRRCMEKDVPEVLPEPVEMDETYIGGQRKNKRLHIRRLQGKRGHGTDKLPIVGVVSRITGQVYVEVLPRKLDIQTIVKILCHRVPRGGTLYTDGFKMYRRLTKDGYSHKYVNHAGGEYVRNDAHTNTIEGFWGILKRKLSCIGGMRRQYLPLFVAEIVWKYNQRNTSLQKQELRLYELLTK